MPGQRNDFPSFEIEDQVSDLSHGIGHQAVSFFRREEKLPWVRSLFTSGHLLPSVFTTPVRALRVSRPQVVEPYDPEPWAPNRPHPTP